MYKVINVEFVLPDYGGSEETANGRREGYIQNESLETANVGRECDIQSDGVETTNGKREGDIKSDGAESVNGGKKDDGQSDGVESSNGGKKDDAQSDGVESSNGGKKDDAQSDGVESSNGGKKDDAQSDGVESANGGKKNAIRSDGVESANGGKKDDAQSDGVESANGGKKDDIRGDGVESATGGRRGNIESDDEENAHGGENEEIRGLIVIDSLSDIYIPVSTKEAQVSGESQNEQLDRELCDLVVNLPIEQKHLFYLLLKENKEGKSKLYLTRNAVGVCDIKEESILAGRIPEDILRIVTVAGKTEETLNTEIEYFCLGIENIKERKTPGGVCLSPSVAPTRLKTYEQGKNYTVQDCLGKGLQATVTVAQDKATSECLARKTVPIDKFEPNEIRALNALRSYGFTPKLHLCTLDNYNILIFMEVLKDAITIKSVIEQLGSVPSLTPVDKMSSALYFLTEALEAIEKMHRVGWLHMDLHSENVMLLKRPDSMDAKSIQIMIIDFGNAIPIKESEKLTSSEEAAAHLSDFVNILMQFCSLALCGSLYEGGFESTMEFKSNHESILSNSLKHVPGDFKELFRDVVKKGFQIKHAQLDGPEFVQFVKNKVELKYEEFKIDRIGSNRLVALEHLRFEKPMLGLHPSSKLNVQSPPIVNAESSILDDSNISVQNIIPAAPPPPPVRTKISGHSSAAIATEDGNNGQPENGRGEALQAAIQETTDHSETVESRHIAADQLERVTKKGGTFDVRHFGTQTDFVAHSRCYKCGEQGHLGFACWYQRAIKCFQCHKYGHKQKHCEQRF